MTESYGNADHPPAVSSGNAVEGTRENGEVRLLTACLCIVYPFIRKLQAQGLFYKDL